MPATSIRAVPFRPGVNQQIHICDMASTRPYNSLCRIFVYNPRTHVTEVTVDDVLVGMCFACMAKLRTLKRWEASRDR